MWAQEWVETCGGGYVGPPRTIDERAASGFDFPYEVVVERLRGYFAISSLAKKL